MIGKLLKYEIQSTYRIFLTILCSFILLTVLLCIGMVNQNEILLLLFSLTSVAIGFGTFFAYFITIIQRYYKGLYGREGYLMLTLPVHGWQLVLSKFLVAMFWSILLGITIFLCLVVTLQWSISLAPASYQLDRISFIKEVIRFLGIKNIVFLSIATLVAIAGTIANIYASISIAYLPCFKKWNIPLALFLYFCIDVIERFVISGIYSAIQGTTVTTNDITYLIFNTISYNIRYWSGYGFVIISFCITAMLLCLCSYILTKKVNIR